MADVDPIALAESIARRLRDRANGRRAAVASSDTPEPLIEAAAEILEDVADAIESAVHWSTMDFD